MIIQSQCALCKHFHSANVLQDTCDAFPTGIPEAVLLNEVSHRRPVNGDHGIRFEPREPVLNDLVL